MAAPIKVGHAFVADFNFLCQRLEIVGPEETRLREDVRRDFDTVGAWVSETAAVYRFCDEVWGALPTAELCQGYLKSKGWWPADETIFTRYGIMLLAKLCAMVAGAVPWPAEPAPQ